MRERNKVSVRERERGLERKNKECCYNSTQKEEAMFF